MKEKYVAPALEITELPDIKTDSMSDWCLYMNTDWFST